MMKNYIKTILFVVLASIFLFRGNSQNYNSGSTLPGADKNNSKGKASAGEAGKTGVQNVIIIYKTHFDIGYSERVQQVVHDYRTSMADLVLNAIDRNSVQPREKQFVWTVSGWPMKQIIWDGQEPVRKKKLEQAIISGNLAVHAYPFTIHTETSDLEDMVRGLNISSKIARKYNKPLSISAKTTDVPGQSWLIPTLFTHSGIKFYHFGGPVVNLEFGLPMFFWWEGPDGSRLLTLYNNNYGSDPLPPDSWPFKTWIYINMTGDNQGPPSPETVGRDLEFYRSKGISARVGTMDDFTNLIMKEDLSKLPVIRTDIGDPWIHGPMSMPEACKLAQNIRPQIGALDQLNTLEQIWGIYRPDIRSAIASAYEKSLLFSEHTWGLANQHYLKVPYGKEWQELWEKGLPAQYRLMEASWDDHAAYIENVKTLVSEPYFDAVSTIADNINLNENRIVVYNPLPWKRDCEVKFDTRLIFGNDFVSIKPADGGAAIPVTHEYPSIEDKAPMSRFVVHDIPPMGYRTYIPSFEKVEGPEMKADQKTGIIESPFFKAVVDAEKGRIVSLTDKRNGAEIVDAGAPQGFGQYFYERFGYKQISDWIDKSLYQKYMAHRFIFTAYDMPKDVPYSSALPENMELTVEKTTIDVKAVLTGTLTGPGQMQKISISLTLSGIMPVADIEVSWQKQPDSWPEAGWICLPFNVNNARFRLGRLGADVDPVKDMIVDNSNFHMWWVNNGVAVYDSLTGNGYGIASPDAPLVSLGEPGEYKFDKRYVPVKPFIYLNLYNNHWRTNFASWIGKGQPMSARIRLWSFDRYFTESSLFGPAMETRVPVQAASSKVKNGKLPVTQQGISLSRKGVAITAFGPNPDGAGTLLRLWEQSGVSGQLDVRLPAGSEFITAQPVNLRGEVAGISVPIRKGVFSISLPAYSPFSYILK
jgi:alpha-mannosidase